MLALTLTSSARERTNTKRGSSHEHAETENEAAEPRPSQEGRGSRRSAHCRGDDPAGAPSRSQAHPGSHGKGSPHQPGRRFASREAHGPSPFHASKKR